MEDYMTYNSDVGDMLDKYAKPGGTWLNVLVAIGGVGGLWFLIDKLMAMIPQPVPEIEVTTEQGETTNAD